MGGGGGGQNFIIFSPPPPNPQKGGEKTDFAAARLATISATRWTGNKLFFKGGLITGRGGRCYKTVRRAGQVKFYPYTHKKCVCVGGGGGNRKSFSHAEGEGATNTFEVVLRIE